MRNQAPPIGLRPIWVAASLRIQEILEAMLRYQDAGWPIPQLWLDELKFQNQRQKELEVPRRTADALEQAQDRERSVFGVGFRKGLSYAHKVITNPEQREENHWQQYAGISNPQNDKVCSNCGDSFRPGEIAIAAPSVDGTDYFHESCKTRDGAFTRDENACEGCDGTGGPDKNCAGCGGTGIHCGTKSE